MARARAFILGYKNGGKVQHSIIQYLNQRKKNEVNWLESLKNSNIHATLVWGKDDKIALTKVSDYVWTNYLKGRTAKSDYWIIPYANHYIQNDKPELLNILIRKLLGEEVDFHEISEKEKPYCKSP